MHPTFPSFRRQPPVRFRHRFDTLPFSVTDFLRAGPPPSFLRALTLARRSGLRRSLAGSPSDSAESRSSSYGPMIHLRLLPTLPHGNAVPFGYRPESVCLKGTSTPQIECTLRRTSGRRPRRPGNATAWGGRRPLRTRSVKDRRSAVNPRTPAPWGRHSGIAVVQSSGRTT